MWIVSITPEDGKAEDRPCAGEQADACLYAHWLAVGVPCASIQIREQNGNVILDLSRKLILRLTAKELIAYVLPV